MVHVPFLQLQYVCMHPEKKKWKKTLTRFFDLQAKNWTSKNLSTFKTYFRVSINNSTNVPWCFVCKSFHRPEPSAMVSSFLCLSLFSCSTYSSSPLQKFTTSLLLLPLSLFGWNFVIDQDKKYLHRQVNETKNLKKGAQLGHCFVFGWTGLWLFQ